MVSRHSWEYGAAVWPSTHAQLNMRACCESQRSGAVWCDADAIRCTCGIAASDASTDWHASARSATPSIA